MIIIDDINDPRLIYYKNLRYTPQIHLDNRIFIAESEKVILKLLNSNLKIISILSHVDYFNKYSDLFEQKQISPENTYIASKEILNRIVGYRLHSGIMGIAEQPDDTDLNQMSSHIIAVNGIIDSENIGSIVRNMSAFGFDSLIVDEKSSSPYLRRAVRVGMGNVIDLKINHSNSLRDSLINLKTQNYTIIAAEITQNSIDLNNFNFPDKYCLIFGNEGSGIDKEILNLCEFHLKIPINTTVSSINVAAASAIFFHSISNKSNKN